MHRADTIICDESHIRNRSSFSCARHGPYLLVVLLARLIYMFIFTLTFFYFVFTEINSQHYHTLNQYDDFADHRDEQLLNLSANIEAYYYSFV